MACFEGKPTEIIPGTPKDVQGLRKQLIDMISGGMNQGATPYSGPIGTTADPGQLAAMNMLMGLSGNGKYSQGGSYSMPNQPKWNTSNTTKTPVPGGPPRDGSPVPGNPGWKGRIPPDPGGPIDDGGIYKPMSGAPDARGIAAIVRLMQSRGMR